GAAPSSTSRSGSNSSRRLAGPSSHVSVSIENALSPLPPPRTSIRSSMRIERPHRPKLTPPQLDTHLGPIGVVGPCRRRHDCCPRNEMDGGWKLDPRENVDGC